MALTIYKKEDIMPMVVYVLHLCACNYCCNAFKFAIKDYYPDLKGLVTTDVVDDSMLELLDAIPSDNELFALMLDSCAFIQDAKESISFLYIVDLKKMPDNDPVSVLANVFYLETTIDSFPFDGEDDFYDDEDYFFILDLYASSLVNVINWLFIVILDGEADLDLSFDGHYFYTGFQDKDYAQHEHTVALDMLRELGVNLNEQRLAILEYTQR